MYIFIRFSSGFMIRKMERALSIPFFFFFNETLNV